MTHLLVSHHPGRRLGCEDVTSSDAVEMGWDCRAIIGRSVKTLFRARERLIAALCVWLHTTT
jgi:hypothetical protein